MDDHPHRHDEPQAPQPTPGTAVDAGSQAFSEALRSSFGIVKFVMVALLLIFLGSGIFIVGQQERAIVLRLGKPVGQGEKALRMPGLQISFPYPIDDRIKVSFAGIQKVNSTVGWFAITPEQELSGQEPYAGATLNPAVDGYLLTADNNIVHSRATLTYRVADPVGYLFNFVNASNAVQNVLNNALLYAASHFKVDDILTRDRAGFKDAVRQRVAELADRQKLGILVGECLVESRPPRQLKDAFDNVLKAEIVRSKVLNEARSYENQVTNRAGADAKSLINSASSESVMLVNDVSSEADRFSKLLPEYQRNPDLFVQKFLTEMLGRTLPDVQDKIFLAEGLDGKPKELRLLLNRELPKRGTEQAPGGTSAAP